MIPNQNQHLLKFLTQLMLRANSFRIFFANNVGKYNAIIHIPTNQFMQTDYGKAT